MLTAVFTLILPQTPLTNAEQFGGVPYVELFDIDKLRASENMYKVLFKVHAGNQDMLKLELYVSSDISGKYVPVTTVFAHQLTNVPVIIQADDPSSIRANMVLLNQ